MNLKAPFPWFGGKSKVAPEVWHRFGRVRNYVEPFMGSLAMLLGRPTPFEGTETVNDADGFLCNFWRAVQHDPRETAFHADWPVSESDLHARHVWLKGRRGSLVAKLEGDPNYFDAKIAGWWAWGQCCWIGAGWCDDKRVGPWEVHEIDGVKQLVNCKAKNGARRKLVHLGDPGKGVNRQRVHLGDAGKGVNRQRVSLAQGGKGVHRKNVDLEFYFQLLSDRLQNVRVCSGDWSRVCGPSPTTKLGLTAVFLDPPYPDTACRDENLYAKDSASAAHGVREWAISNGGDPLLRIALAGYEGQHEMPRSWDCWAWKATGGYASQRKDGDDANCRRERVWFSPHCIGKEPTLFGEAE